MSKLDEIKSRVSVENTGGEKEMTTTTFIETEEVKSLDKKEGLRKWGGYGMALIHLTYFAPH